MSNWQQITITPILYSVRDSQITCALKDCNHFFMIGEKAVRQGNGCGKNRYFCVPCAKKLRH